MLAKTFKPLLMGLLAACWGSTSIADSARVAFPSRDVQIVVPSEPGGGLDLVARLLAKGLTASLAQPVNVINRSGASGNVGTASVARAAADGHTLLLTGVGHLVSPLLHSQPGYDPQKDFEPVAMLATAPNVLVVHQALAGRSLAQLLDDPRSRSTGLAYASAGYGHSSHLAAEVFMARTGARWLHVPYRGTSPALRALLAGEVQLMFVPAGSVQTVLAGGQTHALAVAHGQRLESLPNTPTLAESGVQGAEFSQWYGLFAPAGTPLNVLSLLQSSVTGWMAGGETRRQLRSLDLQPAVLGQGEFAKFLAHQSTRLASIVKKEQIEGASK